MALEIMDTTLRDGEQTSGVSFNPREKLQLARLLLDELNLDRIEIASARVSDGEYDGVREIVKWARETNNLGKIEVLGFVDNYKSVKWIYDSGARVINLLCKGSLNHLKGQLKKSPEEHYNEVLNTIDFARSKNMDVNVYLEDWSNGMQDSPAYVNSFLDKLQTCGVKRVMLADTLGVLNYEQSYMLCKELVDNYPMLHFDFHSHNDYDLATANTYAAIKAGISGIHTTVNGLGERAGNVALSSIVGILHDHLGIKTKLNESKICMISKLVETISGIRIPDNKPLIGASVFTQTCGVHADGDSKAQLYYNKLMPERFGRVRKYALGKTSGKANILKNLEDIGLNLDNDSLKKVTDKVIELGDKKENVTVDDLPYIISDVLENTMVNEPVKILNYSLAIASGIRPVANIIVEINGDTYEENSVGDGQYDAFMKALRKIYKRLNRPSPKLLDYVVSIPPGGRTDALVDTSITWSFNGKEYKTRGIEADQTQAAIKATQRMLNIIEKLNKE